MVEDVENFTAPGKYIIEKKMEETQRLINKSSKIVYPNKKDKEKQIKYQNNQEEIKYNRTQNK